MKNKRDYYEVLGIDRSASSDEIRKTYRKLAMQHHPDKHGGDDAKFKELGEAYETLKDEQKRAAYDRFGHAFRLYRRTGLQAPESYRAGGVQGTQGLEAGPAS